MLGVVFTEFIESVERGYGLAVADRVQCVCPAHIGFTAVGNYDHGQLVSMIGKLSEETDVPVANLIRQFGRQIFQSFLNTRPETFQGIRSTPQLLETVENTVHVDVLSIYPNAELPKLSFPPHGENEFRLEYQSSRPFAELAHGILEASIEYFQEHWQVTRHDLDGPVGTHALFVFSFPSDSTNRLSPEHRE